MCIPGSMSRNHCRHQTLWVRAGTALASSGGAPAGRHDCCDFSIAFRMTSNFLMHATRAILGAFPPAVRCLWNCRVVALNRIPATTDIYKSERKRARPPDSPMATRLAAVVVERRDAHDGSDLLPVQCPEFRQFGNDAADQNGPTPGTESSNSALAPPFGVLRNKRFHLLVGLVEPVSQQSHCGVNVPPSTSRRRHSSVSLCDDDFPQLTMPCDEVIDFL